MSNEIQQFFAEISVKDIYQHFNNYNLHKMNKTHNRGLWLIDSIAISINLLQVIEGSKLLESNDIIAADHHSYVIDINLEDYFVEQFSTWNEINHRLLDSSRRSY